MMSVPTILPSGTWPATGRTVVVLGHGLVVSEGLRAYVVDKMDHLARYDGGIDRYEVGLFHELNPRPARASDRVEITAAGPGVTVRVRARGPGFGPAFAAALTKIEARLHRLHDRAHSRRRAGLAMSRPLSPAGPGASVTSAPERSDSAPSSVPVPRPRPAWDDALGRWEVVRDACARRPNALLRGIHPAEGGPECLGGEC